MRNSEQYTTWQLTFLVLLRVLIGWHFLYEGLAKLLKPGWSAAGFLLQSKGIFAGLFQAMAHNDAILSAVNFLNIWGLILIGLGLILGGLTRIACLAGAALVLLYYIANPPFPGLYYSLPMEGNYLIVNKNLVEMAALLVLFVFPTGEILGLDHFLRIFINRKKNVT